MNGPGGSFDITQRVVWSSSNPVAADVSNFVLPGSNSTITNILPFRGPVTGGQSILIRGTGFTPGSFVTFNGQAATTLYVTTEELSVITPAGSVGSASVVVTTTNSSSSTPAAYYYDP